MNLSLGLQDMSFIGSKFTWSNNCRGTSYVAARLDRALCNHLWFSLSCDPQLSHLPKYSSDHCPLLLSHNQRPSSTNVPFNFEAMWIQHPEFLRLVEDNRNSGLAGNPQYILTQNLKMMKQILKAWNRNVFGDTRLKVLLAKAKVQTTRAT